MTRRPLLPIALLAAVAGCTSALETEYKPRPLNATEGERRAHYAPAYTPESHPAKDGGGGGLSPLGPG